MRDKKENNIEIGGRIKKAREEAGLTQERFAELIDMGPKNASAIERGAVGISICTLQKICTVLSVSSDRILFGELEKADVSTLSSRLSRLTPEQLKIAEAVLNKLLEAFYLGS